MWAQGRSCDAITITATMIFSGGLTDARLALLALGLWASQSAGFGQ